MLKRSRAPLPEGCISDLRFEMARTGALDAAEQAALAQHVLGCARCSERQRELAAQLASIEAQLPRFAPRMRRPSVMRRSAPYLAALAVAACAMLLLLPERSLDTTRSKGGPALGFYVKRDGRVFRGQSGERVAPGDQLRFVLRAPGFTHVAIFSRNATGETSLYHPAGSQAAPIVQPHTEHALDGAIQLDDTLVDEQVVALFCRATFATETARRELADTGALAARDGCAQAQLTLHKGDEP